MSDNKFSLAEPEIIYNPKIEEGRLRSIDIQFRSDKGPVDFTYVVRDYGELPLWIASHLMEQNTLPEEWRMVEEIYALDKFFVGMPPRRKRFIEWTLIRELPQIDVLVLKKKRVKRRGTKRKTSLGPFGDFLFDVVKLSPNWLISFENLVLLRLLGYKLKNLGTTLYEIYKHGSAKCVSSSHWPSFKIFWDELSANLWDICLIHAEKPDVIPEFRDPNIPQVLSGAIYNESYLVHSALRKILLEKFASTIQNRGFSMDIYELSTRTPNEISRAFREIGILQNVHGLEFVSIPDRMLRDLVIFSLHWQTKTQTFLKEFTDVVKDQFRILIDPYDIKNFLERASTYASLGIDLMTMVNYFKSNYEIFIERLKNLGLAKVRPDGEVTIETI
jgi:hypothetical protein